MAKVILPPVAVFICILFAQKSWAGVHFPQGSANIITTAVTFEWNEVPNADLYRLWLGSSRGANDIAKYTSNTPSRYVSNLQRGSELFVSIGARVDGLWQTVDDEGRPPYSISADPVVSVDDSNLLSGSIQQFRLQLYDDSNDGEYWADIKRFQLLLGTADDADAYGRWRGEIDESAYQNAHFITAGGLPTDGSSVEAKLLWYGLSGGIWRWHHESISHFYAADKKTLLYPEPGSVLSGSATTVRWLSPALLQNAEWPVSGYQWWFGTESDPDAYGRTRLFDDWYGFPWVDDYRHFVISMDIVGLPEDGSEIIATRRWHDGSRWRADKTNTFTAANEKSEVWGTCTPVDRGVRPVLIPLRQPLWSESWIEDGEQRFAYAGERGAFRTVGNRKADNLLRDGCASDSDVVNISGMQVYLPEQAKGVYLWLAADSGAAEIRRDLAYRDSIPEHTLAIQPDAGVPKPVFLALSDIDESVWEDKDTWHLTIHPVDANAPVRISEIRIALDGDDVSDLRKLRFLNETEAPRSFSALNGDPRARVTGELNQLFGPSYDFEGYAHNIDTCGLFNWVDATWEIEQGIILPEGLEQFDRKTIWINWEKASNEEIIDAINQSVDAGENQQWPYFGCTRAEASLIYQDWKAKAADALAGSYDGPVLRYE